MRCAVFHLTPLIRLDEPTPRIDEDTTCVVDNGKCNDEATNIVNVDDKSAAAPFAVRIFMIFPPTVLMIFQRPTAIPNPIAVEQTIFIHNHCSVLVQVWIFAIIRDKVIILIDFCASFVPCENDCSDAVKIWKNLKLRFVLVRLAFLNTTFTIEYIIKPTQKAIIGDKSNTTIIFVKP